MNKSESGLIEELLPILISNGKGNFSPKQIEAANKFKKFIDRLPGGFLIYRADEKEEIIYANIALIRMFECKNAKEFARLTDNSFKGIVYKEDYDEVVKSIEHQISGEDGNVDYVEYRIVTKSGKIRYVEDYGHFAHTKAGNMYYVFITDATDKTAKRQQEHSQRLEVIAGLSVNYDSILYVDLNTDKVMPYRLSKRLFKQFDGKMEPKAYSFVTEDFVNSWIHPDDRDNIREILSPEYIRKNLENSPTYHANFRCVFEGNVQFMRLRIVDVGKNGQISQIVIGSQNIEEELKQELQQKALLEKALQDAKLANATKNAFLSNMSHDMRTPLNAIFGYLELAKKNLKTGAPIESHLDSIYAAGKQLLDLVDKVLHITYIESKDFKLRDDPCDLKELATEVFDELLPFSEKKKLRVTLNNSGVIHPEVYTDRDQLKQILLNLARNAVQYTASGGEVKLTIEENTSRPSDFAAFRFEVQDTGIGIAPESLEKIFDPFERENNSTHSGVFGSGLGLTIAKKIVDGMGGTITAESKVGVGSTFTVNLSFRLAEHHDTDLSTDDVEAFLKGKKILLVEDNEINMEIETELLEDLGLIIEPAENGQIAVDKMSVAEPNEYLFVLMDIQMPVMDGWQATEGIRTLPDPAVANIPIIALSANAFESDKRASAENGMNAHLNKPMDIPILLKAIRKTVMNK